MTYADITLTHADVNSGTAVEIQATNVNLTYSNLVKADPVAGKDDIVEADIGGFGENPAIIVEGAIKVTDIASNTITQALLLDFKQVTSEITMEIIAGTYSGSPAVNQRLRGRPTAGYSIGGTLTNTLSVLIKDIKLTFGVDEEQGAIWRYSITFIETT